jgi:hypothetical protein
VSRRVTVTGLELPPDLGFEQWRGIGAALQGVERSVMWWIGDWLRHGERRWGERYKQAVEKTGKSYDNLRTAKAVADRVGNDRRRSNLRWSHHADVAFLAPIEADELLARIIHEAGRREARSRFSSHSPHCRRSPYREGW